MEYKIFEDKNELNKYAAEKFKEVITSKDNPVIGLATGSSPVGMYNELIKMYNYGELSFKNVTSFNLDEYFGLDASHDQSYYYFMNENLFKHIDIDLNNVHVPKGVGNIEENATSYEKDLENSPVDIQILGVGRNGHIAFNEPGTSFDSVTHKVKLDEKTREDNARFFESIDEVPTEAITMGLSTIMKSKKIILIATGEAKAEAIKALQGDEVTTDIPVTILKNHPNVEILVDKEAASLLEL